MTRFHVVRPGEHLRGIAHAYGVEPAELWASATNAGLREERGDGSCLLPGDVLRLPDAARPRSAALRVGTANGFRARVPLIRVRVELRDRGQPLADEPWEADDGGRQCSGITSAEGVAELKVRVTSRRVRLELPERREVLFLDVGGLDPADAPSGVEQRLRRLGLLVGPAGADALRAALTRFQEDQRLTISGLADAETVAALEAAARGST